MRIFILLAISAATLVSADANNDTSVNNSAGTNSGVGTKMKKKKKKRPRKAVLANDTSNDNSCYLSDADFAREEDGVMVINQAALSKRRAIAITRCQREGQEDDPTQELQQTYPPDESP